jgi:hypothetical protein
VTVATASTYELPPEHRELRDLVRRTNAIPRRVIARQLSR